MKEFRLSTPAERVGSTLFVAFMTVCFGLLLYALRRSTGLMIVCGLGILLITVVLVFYVVSVLKAACIVESGSKTVQVKGISDYTVDVSKAVLVQTVAKKNGQTNVRVIVFADEEMNIVATIPTMFTYKQGMMAEPMAEKLANELGIEFKRTIPEWEFDKKLYEEHQKQVAAEEKAEAKKRRQARMAYRIQKRKDRLGK